MRQQAADTTPGSGEGAATSKAAKLRARGAVQRELGVLALFVALTAFHTWPLASAPGRWSRNDNGDALLNEWAVAWVAHQLPRDPIHLFDANIFCPERRTLAFSEHLVVQATMVAPVMWVGGSAVLAHNLALLAGFALTGWAMCFVISRWTGSRMAGLVAGSLAAFNAHTLTRLAHLQAQHLEFLALALFAFDRLLATPRVRHALAMGGWVALQSLTSIYFLLFTAVAMIAAAAVRPAEWMGRRFRRVAPLVLAGAAAAGAVLLPFLFMYWAVRRDHTVVRTLKEVALFSASVRDYLSTGALVHWGWSQHVWTGNALFPGVIATILALVAIVSGIAWKDRRARMWLAIGVATFTLSLGTNVPFYGWLFRHVPLFDAIRAVNRFGQFALVALAALAGFGAAFVLARVGSRKLAAAVGLSLVALVNAEAWRGPIHYTAFEGIPPLFRTLAGVRGAVVAYVPFWWFSGEIGLNGVYMLASTENWKPMLTGYSGFVPSSARRSIEALKSFPSDESLEYLRHAGVTHVVVDSHNLRPPVLERISRTDALRRWTSDERFTIYELK